MSFAIFEFIVKKKKNLIWKCVLHLAYSVDFMQTVYSTVVKWPYKPPFCGKCFEKLNLLWFLVFSLINYIGWPHTTGILTTVLRKHNDHNNGYTSTREEQSNTHSHIRLRLRAHVIHTVYELSSFIGVDGIIIVIVII